MKLSEGELVAFRKENEELFKELFPERQFNMDAIDSKLRDANPGFYEDLRDRVAGLDFAERDLADSNFSNEDLVVIEKVQWEISQDIALKKEDLLSFLVENELEMSGERQSDLDLMIYVANVRKYNDGELTGEWFDLPVDMEEIYEKVFEPHELDENGKPYGDFAIYEYDLPFKISEFQNIDKLNEVAKYLRGLDSAGVVMEGNYTLADAVSFAREVGNAEVLSEIIEAESMNQRVTDAVKEVGWVKAKFMLEDVRDVEATHFKVNGYGNFENFDYGDEKEIVEKVFEDIKKEYLDQPVKEVSLKRDRSGDMER